MQQIYQPCDIVRRITPLRCYGSSLDFNQKKYKAAKINPILFSVRDGETEEPFVRLVSIGDALELRDRRERDWNVRWAAKRTEAGIYVVKANNPFNQSWLGDGEKYSVRELHSMMRCPKRIPVVDESFAEHLLSDLERYESYRRKYSDKASKGCKQLISA